MKSHKEEKRGEEGEKKRYLQGIGEHKEGCWCRSPLRLEKVHWLTRGNKGCNSTRRRKMAEAI